MAGEFCVQWSIVNKNGMLKLQIKLNLMYLTHGEDRSCVLAYDIETSEDAHVAIIISFAMS